MVHTGHMSGEAMLYLPGVLVSFLGFLVAPNDGEHLLTAALGQGIKGPSENPGQTSRSQTGTQRSIGACSLARVRLDGHNPGPP